MSKKTKVLTYGTFDLLHFGHVRLLQRAKQLGDELYVGISTDEFNAQKGKNSVINFHHRKFILESIKYVNHAIPETSWDQKIDDIKKYKIDIFTIGDDWEGKFDFLNNFCEVIYLPRSIGVSSTELKEALKGK